MSDSVPIAFQLHQAIKHEAARREQGLPPVDVGLHFSVKTDSGYVRKGLRGEVICEIDGGRFDVFVKEAAIIDWLKGEGISWRGARLDAPLPPVETQGGRDV